MMRHLVDPALLPLVAEQRAYIRSMPGPFAPPPDNAQVLPAIDMVLPDHPQASVRIIKPNGAVRGVYLHIHGGGFMHGDAAVGDVSNSALAHALSLVTVSVEYRLAPAHPHPAALHDCVAAARWLVANAEAKFGTTRLLIGGESVGASLVVMTLLRLRDDHYLQPFAAANLCVGNYDFSMTPSQRASTTNLFLSPEHLAEMRAAAFPGLDLDALRDPVMSTLYADLRGLPPALFSVGTTDSVLDDSLFMAARWQTAGNEAELAVYPDAPHLFMTYPTRMAAAAHERIAAFLHNHLQV
jgi:acetyl esterase